MTTNYNDNNYDADISFYDLLIALWQKKILVFCITLSFAIFSVFYALSLPNIYSSKATLAPTTADESLTSQLGNYSALAGLAGINIPNNLTNKSTEAIERIKSYDFFVNEFLPYIQYENLVAANEWNQTTNTIVYNEDIFDSNNSKWVRVETSTQKAKPSYQEAFQIYNNVIDIQEDGKTFYYNFTVEHLSPYIAQKWLSVIIKNINEYMRKLDRVHRMV